VKETTSQLTLWSHHNYTRRTEKNRIFPGNVKAVDTVQEVK